MKTQPMILILSMGLAHSTLAAPSDAGFKQIDENIANAQGNLDDYKAQMVIVDKNIAEVSKAKSAANKQSSEIAKLEKENAQSLKALKTDEAKAQELMQKEKQNLATEDKKIQELEALIQKIKTNKTTRETNMTAHQQSLQQLGDARKAFEQKAQNLASSREQNKKQLKEISALEKDWANKQKGYQAEIKRWDAEVNKQKNQKDQLSSLGTPKPQ